jgi:ABC-type branched-subunit amino acid transport system substrate-binding protein
VRNKRTATVILAVSAVIAGCAREPKTAWIAYTMGTERVRKVVEAVLDSTASDGERRVEVVGPGVLHLDAREPYLIQMVVEALAWVRRPEVVGVVGPAGSGEAMLVGPVYQESGLPFVLPTANTPQLRALGRGAFLMAPSLAEEAGFIGEFVTGPLQARSALIMYDPGAWGASLQAALATELWSRGVQLLGRYPAASTSACGPASRVDERVASALRDGRPDVVLLGMHDAASACVIASFERQAPGLTFVGGDGTVLSERLMQEAGAAPDRVYAVAFTNPATASPQAATFRRLFQQLNGYPPTWLDAASFDATMVLVTAVREVGAKRAAVARYLEQLGRERPPYSGITGLVTFLGERSDRLQMQSGKAMILADSGSKAE